MGLWVPLNSETQIVMEGRVTQRKTTKYIHMEAWRVKQLQHTLQQHDKHYGGVINEREMAFKINSATLQETVTFLWVWEEVEASEFHL